MNTLCDKCSDGAAGETGHPDLAFYVGGPYPGHNIFRCRSCDERWIRHYAETLPPFAWTRYTTQFGHEIRRPNFEPARPRTSAA